MCDRVHWSEAPTMQVRTLSTGSQQKVHRSEDAAKGGLSIPSLEVALDQF